MKRLKRREAVKLIAVAGATGAVGAAQQPHAGHGAQTGAKSGAQEAGAARKKAAGAAPAGKHKYFSEHEYAVVSRLADLILPRDGTPGALDAGVPAYIDLQIAEMPEAQVHMSGGIQWLDRYCTAEFGQPFLKCTPEQQKAFLDRVAIEKNVPPELHIGRVLFAQVRDFVCDGFYTSKLGFKELGYRGNTFNPKFEGCPHPEHRS